MNYYLEFDLQSNEFKKLHLDVHRIDCLKLNEIELNTLFFLTFIEVPECSLVNHAFSKERFNQLVNDRILRMIVKENNRVLFTLKNKFYKKLIREYWGELLRLKDDKQAEEWAVAHGYVCIQQSK